MERGGGKRCDFYFKKTQFFERVLKFQFQTIFKQMSEVSELEVQAWQTEEVKMWANYYGFLNEDVISNINQFSIWGPHILLGINADELGIKEPLGIFMYDERFVELKHRDMMEKSRRLTTKKRLTDGYFNVKKRSILEQMTEDEVSEDENDEVSEEEADEVLEKEKEDKAEKEEEKATPARTSSEARADRIAWTSFKNENTIKVKSRNFNGKEVEVIVL